MNDEGEIDDNDESTQTAQEDKDDSQILQVGRAPFSRSIIPVQIPVDMMPKDEQQSDENRPHCKSTFIHSKCHFVFCFCFISTNFSTLCPLFISFQLSNHVPFVLKS